MKKKYHVTLSGDERQSVLETMNTSGTPKTIRKRCFILLLADETMGSVMAHEEISKRCNAADVTVCQTIKDYCLNGLD